MVVGYWENSRNRNASDKMANDCIVQKVAQEAITSIEKARNILTQLFPNIKSLKSDVREDLEAEFADIC